jgi:hypothetical protein
VIGFAALYASVPLVMHQSIFSAVTGQCESIGLNSAIRNTWIAEFILALCQWRILASYLLSAFLVAITLVVHRAPLMRGPEGCRLRRSDAARRSQSVPGDLSSRLGNKRKRTGLLRRKRSSQ